MKNRLASAAAFALAALFARPALAQTPYSHGDPTADEQLVLEIINRARANPAAEGTRLGISITEGLTAPEAALVGPRPPLAMNARLLAAARLHSQDMINRAYFDHFSPAPVTSPSDRIDAQGYVWTRMGENIAMSSSDTAAGLEDNLMIDAGVPGRGHRKNLLDINSTPYYREIGAGYAHTSAGVVINSFTWRDFLTQDFGLQQAGQPTPGPFLVGVVRNDANGNDFYDLGEGMSGVTITISGNAYSAVSSTSGGFAIPLTAGGTLVVTASGGGLLGPVTKSIAATSENIKLDFELQDIPDTDLDGMPDSWETANGLNPNVDDAAGDADADGFSNLEEFQGNSNPQSGASVPAGDKDGDGMPNSWEVANGLNALSAADAAQDADADGFNNLEEYQGGGDPRSSASAPAGDKDGDGMPNPWEVQNLLDPFVNDAAGDADGDAFTNLAEYQSGSNPRDPVSVPGDNDGDGMSNSWELAYGFNTLSAADAAQDADADGFSNLEEFQGGGNPRSAASAPAGDKDGDGMPNSWEVRYLLNPFVNDASGDADGDTLTNLGEYQGGSNPLDANSPPKPEEEDDDSKCGCTGLELFAPLTLAWLARRRRLFIWELIRAPAKL